MPTTPPDPRPVLVKIGGSTFGQHETTLDDVAALWQSGTRLVLVHGGGKLLTTWLDRLAIPSRFEEGLRVTTPEVLDVAVATLAGLANKELVAALAARGVPAVGISGADGGLVQCTPAGGNLGAVGVVTAVDPGVVLGLLDAGFLPVVATLGAGKDGRLYNVNGDTTAGAIALALGAAIAVFLSDTPGVRGQDGEILPRLDAPAARTLMSDGTISGGMIPKIENALACLSAVERVVIADGRVPGLLRDAVRGRDVAGTILEAP